MQMYKYIFSYLLYKFLMLIIASLIKLNSLIDLIKLFKYCVLIIINPLQYDN